LGELASGEEAGKWQQRLWGLDAPAIARRLARHWKLPDWLRATAGHLALPVETAAPLGAGPDRFLIVQLGVCLVEHAKLGLGLTTGATREELSRALDLSTATVDGIRAEVPRFAREGTLPSSWSSPYGLALLPDLLRLALANRRAAGPSAHND